MEVIYTGLHQTPEQIVETAIQEDADAVGISILSGAHMTLVPRILDGLKENGVEDVLVVVGGHDPERRRRRAERQGRRGGLHARRADERDRRLPARRRSLSSPFGTCPGTVPGHVRLGLHDDARRRRARPSRRPAPRASPSPAPSRRSPAALRQELERGEREPRRATSIPSSDAVSGTDTPTFWPVCLILRPPGHERTCSRLSWRSSPAAVTTVPVSASVNVVPGRPRTAAASPCAGRGTG